MTLKYLTALQGLLRSIVDAVSDAIEATVVPRIGNRGSSGVAAAAG